MTRLIKNISYLIKDAGEVIRDTDLLIKDGKVASIGRDLGAPEGTPILDASGCAVYPGLINAHTHLWQLTLMGRRDDLPLGSWIDEILTPGLDRLYSVTDEAEKARLSYLWTSLGICEMLRCGVTAFLDMDLNYAQAAMHRAAEEAGVRGFFGIETADWYADAAEENEDLKEAVRLLKTYGSSSVLTPSELNLCADRTLEGFARAACETGCPVQIHLDETEAEALRSLNERGDRELFYLDRFGLLSESFSAVHGVHMTDDEIRLAAEKGITVVYNPKSNMKLGSGVCPVRKLLDAGINVSLATDGPASNDRLDMFEEMRSGALLQKGAAGDAGALLAEDVFRMATEGGSKMLGLNGGALMEGKDADLAVLPLNKTSLITDGSDIISAIVYCARSGDVRDVLVGGEPVLENHRPIAFDEYALVEEFTDKLKKLKEEHHD